MNRKNIGCAALLALAMAMSLPYFYSDPESFVFRGGVFSAILLLFSLPSLLNGKKAAKSLLPCFLFGLCLAFCLSLGSELRAYGGLLPGWSALLRRILIPLMAAPFLGLIAAQLAHLRLGGRCRPVPLFLGAGLLLLLWMPVFLAYYPGMLNYDFPGEYAQLQEGYSHLHPLAHAALMNSVLSLGASLSSPSFGLLLMTLLQMTLFALSLAHACHFLAQRGLPLSFQVLLLLFFGLHPVFSVMALSMTKDTLFAAAVLELTLQSLSLLESPERFFSRRLSSALFILSFCGTALLRNNGILALVLFVPALLCLRRRRILVLTLSAAASALLLFGGLSLALRPASMPTFQLYSLPAQQLVRAYNAGTMSEEERQRLEGWYPDPQGLSLHPHLADPAKGYLDRDRLSREGEAFLDLWRQVGRRNVRVYAEAFLLLNQSSWDPDDTSYATIYPDVSWNEKGALQTQEYSVPGFATKSYLPGLKDLMERICRYNLFLRWPLLSLLFSPAVPFLVLLLSLALLAVKGHARLLAAALPVLCLFLSYLFGPCTLLRYALPLFAISPLFFLMTLLLKEASC